MHWRYLFYRCGVKKKKRENKGQAERTTTYNQRRRLTQPAARFLVSRNSSIPAFFNPNNYLSFLGFCSLLVSLEHKRLTLCVFGVERLFDIKHRGEILNTCSNVCACVRVCGCVGVCLCVCFFAFDEGHSNTVAIATWT